MTIGGCYYFVTFIDDYSHKVWVYFMKAKSEVFGYFQEFKAMVEKETGLQIKCLQSANGGEYTSHAFSDFIKRNGISRHKSCMYTGDLHEEVYMEQLQGYVQYPKKVYKLVKALYGLNHTPRQWCEKISGYLISIGFQVSTTDSSLFVRKSTHGMILLVLYVDDLIRGIHLVCLVLALALLLFLDLPLLICQPIHWISYPCGFPNTRCSNFGNSKLLIQAHV